jgi:hypothetical protein
MPSHVAVDHKPMTVPAQPLPSPARRRLTRGWAIYLVLAAFMASCVSWFSLALGPCGGDSGSPNINSQSDTAWVCRAEVDHWPNTPRNSSRSVLLLIGPVLVTLAGVLLGVLRDRRYTYAVILAVAGFLLAPWLLLAVL